MTTSDKNGSVALREGSEVFVTDFDGMDHEAVLRLVVGLTHEECDKDPCPHRFWAAEWPVDVPGSDPGTGRHVWPIGDNWDRVRARGRALRTKRPWRERDATFDAMVKTQATESPHQIFAESFDGEFYGHQRLAALYCPDKGHGSPEVFLYTVHDEDYTKPVDGRVGDFPEKVSMRAALKACSCVTVNSREQAKAVVKALVAAWGSEVCS